MTNNINGKRYIGKTINLKKRISCYKRLDCYKQPKIFLAISKYGFVNFSIEILAFAQTEVELSKLEMEFIQYYNTMKDGYNCTTGGDGFNSSSHPRLSGNKHPMFGKKGILSPLYGRTSHRRQSVICNETGECFVSFREAAKKLQVNPGTISKCLRGKSKYATNIHGQKYTFKI